MAIRDWPRFARQMFKQTTPGGWVEVVDHPLKTLCCDDNSAPKDSKMTVYMEKLSESLKAAGVNSDLDQHFIKKVLEDAGFQDIRVTIKKVDITATYRVFIAFWGMYAHLG